MKKFEYGFERLRKILGKNFDKPADLKKKEEEEKKKKEEEKKKKELDTIKEEEEPMIQELTDE